MNDWTHIQRFTAAQWLRLFALVLAPFTIRAADITPDPPTQSRERGQVDFRADIFPIFERSCLRCHGPQKPKGGFRLDRREEALKGGESGVDIYPGESVTSPLIYHVTGVIADKMMPPPGKGDPLTAAEIELVQRWIDQGASWGDESGSGMGRELEIEPAFNYTKVDGNEMRFREHQRSQPGLNGGVQHFRWTEAMGRDRTFTTEGRATFGEANYQIQMELRQFDLGYVRFGYEQFQKNFDAPTGAPAVPVGFPIQANQSNEPDTTKIFAETGLRIADWPEVTLRYEYSRDGHRSMIESLRTVPAAGPPDSKASDLQLHTFTADIEKEIAGWLLNDHFQAQWLNLKLERQQSEVAFGGGPPTMATVNEGNTDFQGANTFSVQKELRDGVFVSAGYLYSRIDSHASFTATQTTPPPPVPGPPPLAPRVWFGNNIQLDRRDHVFNFSPRLGPWAGWTLATGIQAELERREGFGNVRLDSSAPPLAIPVVIGANFDKAALSERFSLRYDRIPHTVVFAEADLEQSSIGQFDQLDDSAAGGVSGSQFLRETDASDNRRDFRFGFTHSSWQPASFTAQFRIRDWHSSYTHRKDVSFLPGPLSGLGYSAFILARDTQTDEVNLRLSLRPANWIKTQFTYRYETTDFSTQHDPLAFGLGPGGSLLAGQQEAHHYTATATVTPWRRLLVSATVSLENSKTMTFDPTTAVAPYQGDVLSVLGNTSFVVNDKTDWDTTYSYSRSDYSLEQAVTGPSSSLFYEMHSIQTGFTRRWSRWLTTKLNYAYYSYRNPITGGADDYTAHGVFGSLSIVLR